MKTQKTCICETVPFSIPQQIVVLFTVFTRV